MLSASTYSIPIVRPAAGQVVEPGQHQRPAQAALVPGGVDGDDVDLAERRVVVGVHLGPAEAGHLAVVGVHEEAVGVEPGFGLAGPQVGEGPPALFGVPVERPVVDGQPRLLVVADDERSGGQRPRLVDREGTPNLPEVAHRGEPDRLGEAVVGGFGLRDPQVHRATAGPRHPVQRGAEGGRRGLEALAGRRRVVVVGELQLPPLGTPDGLGVGEGVGVVAVPGRERRRRRGGRRPRRGRGGRRRAPARRPPRPTGRGR